MDNNFDIFVSYHEDGAADLASKLYKILTEKGFTVYVDHILRIKNNGRIHYNIDSIIKNCKIFILLNTIGALDRAEIIREFKVAFPQEISSHKLWVFKENSINVPWVTDKFESQTKINLKDIYQHKFDNPNHLVRQVLEKCEFNPKKESSTIDVIKPKFIRIRRKESDLPLFSIEVQKLRIEADDELDKQNFNKAKEIVEQILTLDPINIYALNALGIIHSINKNYTDAETLFSTCISINNTISAVWSNKAILLDILGKYYESLKCINEAIKIDKLDLDYINTKGSIYFNLKNYVESEKCYDYILTHNRNNLAALVGKSAISARRNKMKESYQLLQKALKIDKENSSIWYNLGVVEFENNNYEGAIKSFNNAIRFKDEKYHVPSLNYLGTIYRNQSKYDKSLEYYDIALKIEPNNEILYFNKGVTFGLMTHPLEALDNFEISLRINPLNTNALINKAIALERLDRENEALIELDKLLEIDKFNIHALESKASILYDKGLIQESELVCRILSDNNPTNIDYRLSIIECLEKQEKFEEYLDFVQKSLQILPNNEVLESHLCKILIDIRKLDLAEIKCNEIIKANPKNAMAYYNLACINAIVKNSENAISYLKQSIALDKQCVEKARNDRDFENIKFNPNFIKLLE